MKRYSITRILWAAAVISFGLILFIDTVPAVSAQADEQYVSIDFTDVDINVFIKFISELTDKNFIVDQRVKGKVTINSPGRISVDEAYQVFQSVLELHGFTTIQSGEMIKIVPAVDAKSKDIITLLEAAKADPMDQVVTQLIPLKYAAATEMRQLLSPLVSKSSVVLAYTKTNTLIITEVQSNIQRLMRIIEAVDKPGVGQEIDVVTLEYADAGKLVKLLSSVFRPARQAGKKGQAVQPERFIADERTNTIIMLASKNDLARTKELIRMLDKKMPRGSEKIRVYYLENATAEELAKVLQEVPTAQKKGAKKPGKKTAVLLSRNVRIMPDKATNSLVIMAEKDDFPVLEEIIRKLDIPRAMVFIEVLIMEVNVDKDFNLGAQWLVANEVDINNRRAGAGGGFGGGNDYRNILGLVAPPAAGAGIFPPGFSLGIFSELLEIGGIKFPGISALINAFRHDRDVHILSTPQLMTTDNEEATISVGKNVPYQTKSGSSQTESFNTFEYRDVGITLKITPHISKDRAVRLKIFQEVTKLEDLSGGTAVSSTRPTTLKRTVDTTVIVHDKNTVVIGGLIDEGFTTSTDKIPCLGSIPGAGWLFKSRSNSREKTN
ncbi:MAG: type II secretion system protein GspD [Deltaproteobacteria bacterium]|nr:MAG: type II secretion system protein GspD [Deltaproteobacteria bacterium]